MATSYVLQRISLARDYLETVSNAGFQLIDLNMVEPFDRDGKAEYPSKQDGTKKRRYTHTKSTN